MNKQKLWMRMVRGGESLTVEFKVQAPKLERLARTVSAFSNSSGGTLFFGVDDECNLVGLDHVDGTADLITQVAGFHCDPPVEVVMDIWEPAPSTKILVVEVPEAENKPIYAANPRKQADRWPYFRSDKENLPLDKKSIKAMRHMVDADLESEVENLDRHSILLLNRLADTPRQTVPQLARAINIGTHRAKKLMVHLEQLGWIHSFFNEKRREYSLTIPWKKR